MPQIPVYSAETRATGPTASRAASAADFGAGPSEGLQTLGGDIQQVAHIQYEQLARDDVTNVRVEMAKARAELDVQFKDEATKAPPGDTTFEQRFNERVRDTLNAKAGGAQTKEGQRTMALLQAELTGHYAEKAGIFAIQSAGVKAKQSWETSMNAFGSSLITDPTQYESVLRQAMAEINDPNGQYGRLDGATRGELERKARQVLAAAHIQGLVDNGAPELARKKLMDGALDTEIAAADKQRLIKEADVGIRMKDTAAERQELIRKRAEQDAQEGVMSNYISRIINSKSEGGPLSDQEIISNTVITAAQKEHMLEYKLRRAREMAALGESRTNPGEVRKLLLDIHAADDDPRKAYNMDGVMDAYTKGKISTPEMLLLRKEVEQLRDGNTQGFQKSMQNARNAVYTMISRSTLGQIQPEVAADAAYRFGADLERAVAEKRKNNEDPRVLLDPSSKEYLLSPARVGTYIAPARQALAAEAGKTVANQGPSSAGRIGGPAASSGPGLAVVKTDADFDALPRGATFRGPDGKLRQKP